MAKRKWSLSGRLKQYIRKIFLYSPIRREVLERARMKRSKLKKYKCAHCKQGTEKPKVDHIEPVVDVKKGFQGWDEYITRMFCGVENLQVLCAVCHDKKTNEERKKRRRK